MKSLNSAGVKYSWLVEYHNATVPSFGDSVDGWDTGELLIDPSVLPFRYDM